MKKLLCAFVALTAWATYTWAADDITIADIEIPQNGEAVLEVELTSVEKNYGGFQFDVKLPAGITLTKVGKADRLSAIENYSLSMNQTDAENNIFTVLGYNINRQSIAGTSGTIAYLTLQADGSTTVGDVLSAEVNNVVLSTVDEDQIDAANSSFSITIGEPDDGRIKFNETSTTLPTYTAGEKGDVTMTRTIKGGVWNTIVLPFNLTKANATAVFGSDVQFAKFAGFEVDYGDDEENITPIGITINFTEYSIPARGNLAGGTPVLIKTSKDITNPFQIDNVTLTADVKNEEKTDEYGTIGLFTGSFVKTIVPADGLFISNNLFYYSVGSTQIKAFRGWFELGAVLDKETDFGAKLNFTVDEVPTSVDGLPLSTQAQCGKVYTLSGQLVGQDVSVRQLKEGVYIVNGKKLYVK